MIVVGADIFILQEGEQLGLVAFESFNEPFDILVTIVVDQKNLIEAIIQPAFQAIVFFRHKLILSLGEPDGVFEQPKQQFAEGFPGLGTVALIHFSQLGEQMIETPLLCQGGDLVVGAPEVAEQDPFEYGSQNFPDDRRSPAFGDQIVAERFGGEAPKPMGYAVEPPPGLIGAQYPALGYPFSDMVIGGFKEMSKLYPCLGQSPGTDLEATDNGKDFYDIIDAYSNQIMEPGRKHHQAQADHGIWQGIGKGGENDLFAR